MTTKTQGGNLMAQKTVQKKACAGYGVKYYEATGLCIRSTLMQRP